MTPDPKQIRVLVVDDDEDDYFMLRDLISQIGQIGGARLKLDWASSYDRGKATLAEERHDVSFLDFRLGGRTGLELLGEAIADGCRTPMILLTGYGEHEVDLEAMRVGAADYLVKDQISAMLIERAIRYAIHRARSLASVRSLLDSTFEGIFVQAPDGVIVEANRKGTSIFGYEPSEMVGNRLAKFLLEPGEEGLKKMRESKGDVMLEARGVRKDGARIDLEISSKPYFHRDQPARLTTLRDVTSRRQLAAQMLVQDRLASVGLLASSLAHEIGTPLGVIRGRAEYLSLQLRENADIRKNADVIIAQIDRVSKLIRSLLNLARGDEIRHSGEVQLDEVVGDVVDLMGHELRRHSIELRNGMTADVRVAVKAEAEPLHQVLLNLLVNSVHAIATAIEKGRVSGHFIEIDADDLGKQWRISVSDTGCGISRENQRNLFKPFFTTKDIGVGTGLGLATSYRIIESWGGRIECESEEGIGTTFRVTLPKSG